MEESVDTGNSATTSGTSDNNGAGTIEGIMGAMANSTPEAEPKNGDNAEGKDSSRQENTAEVPAWTNQLSEELRNNSELMKQVAKFGKISDLAKSYSELESKLGNSIVKPGKDASTEEVEAFYQKLGKPKSADKYDVADDNGVFKEIAFKNNLSNDQAKAIFTAFQEIGKNAAQQMALAKAANAKATDEALRAEWGKSYDAKITMLQRGVNTYGGPVLGEKLKNSGLLFDTDIIKMFVKLGEEAADAGSSGKTARGGNGYKSTADGGKFSWIEKMQ